MINTIHDLMDAVGAAAPTSASIARRLYKDTECGICATVTDEGLTVAGYAEGADVECPTHTLLFPFSSEQLWEVVNTADGEGCELWEGVGDD